MSSSSTISTVSTTITSSALSSSTAKSDSSTKIDGLNTTEIVVIVSIAIGLLILIILVFVIVLRRRHRPHPQKYEHPEDGSKFVDAVESPQDSFMSKPSKDNLHSMFKRAEADPFIATQTEQRLPPSESQYLNDAYTRPFSSVKNDYEGLATHEMHIVSLDTAQSPKDVGFEAAAFRSGRPSSSRSTIKLPPLSIPEKTLNRSNGERSTKRAVSRKSSKPPDSAWETDDSASLYSAASASASASNYFSKSSLEPVKPPPVPPIPIQFTSPAQSTLPKGTDVIVIAHRRDEEEIITKSPPLLSLSLPSLRFNGDNGEVEEDENEVQIYNVAKLLHSRQSKLPKDAPSRNSSIVSHIERSGSIRPIISPTDEESYRPRYYRLKQKRDSYASNLSPTHIPDSLSTLSTHPRASLVGS